MARHEESLSGGLVTNRDPSLLQPGQLSVLKNAIYRPGTSALLRARGRSQFGVVSATAVDVDGLRDFRFDNDDHYLIAHASANYFTAVVGDTGTFGTLASGIGNGTQLEVIHYRNRFFLLNGVALTVNNDSTAANSNRVAYLSATAAASQLQSRVHGLLPVEAAPASASAGGVFSQTVTGYYEYWTTEVAKITADGAEFILESAFVGSPSTIFVSSTALVPLIQMPTIRNPLATHWRIYRSTKKDKESDKVFPIGFMISETATATAQQGDTLTVTTTSYAFPTTYNTGGQPYDDATNPSNLGADDGSVATLTMPAVLTTQSQGCYGFNLGGFTGSVKGVEVEVQGFVSAGSAPVSVTVTLGANRKSDGNFQLPGLLSPVQGAGTNRTASKSGLITSTSAGAPTTFVLGSASDRWIPSNLPGWSDDNFGANFMAVISISKPNVTVSLDYIRIRVSHAATVDSTVPFPTVVYTFGDITAQVAKNGPPPSSSTGDLFEDTLVVNDVSSPSMVRWSYPGDPEAFPATYYLDLETSANDEVTCIKVVNDTCIVGCLTGLARLNYLPSERDASFDRGKAIKWISRSYGIVNAMCAAIYSPHGGGERLAAISHSGVFTTDGYDYSVATDLDWRRIISLSTTSTPIALINDAENEELLFYYRNDTTSESYLCLHLSYSSEHQLETGMFKVSGPVHMRNFHAASSGRADLKSAWAVPRTNGDTTIYLGYGGAATAAGAGTVYRETGSSIPAEDQAYSYSTRRMFLAGMGQEWKLDQLYGLVTTLTGTQGISYATNYSLTNTATAAGETQSLSVAAGTLLHRVPTHQAAEGLIITVSVTSGHDDIGYESLFLDGEDFGMEWSGK